MHALLNELMDFEDSLHTFPKTNHLYHLLCRYSHYLVICVHLLSIITSQLNQPNQIVRAQEYEARDSCKII